ncbi:MAG: class I SAM-dependent methyltransferase [Candidatus Pacebacteria bacterium]|nr:class I SAM-dependent methyltransferase [Candidatus Paceibacterota bacterium]
MKKEDSNKNKLIDVFGLKLISELHLGLERQGPGSSEMTIKALSFLDNLNENSRVADLGCGTGGQTMILAQNMTGNITGLDFLPGFIDIFNNNAKKLNLQERVKGIVGSMENLPFQKEEFDAIWSEGAIANIGFEKGLNYWKNFLKKGGYVALTYESWFTDERPAEIEKWWTDNVPEISTIGHNILTIQKSGYIPVAAFILPEECWTDNYFIPRETASKALLEKYAGDKTVEDFIAKMRYEAELYSKYKQYYGYVFYIGKKI